MPPPRFACFAIALPLYRVFEYAIDNKAPVIVGARYRLPFANGIKTGVLLNASEHSEFDPARIKPVLDQLDQHAILDEHMLALVRWMSDYYLQPLGEVVFQCIPGYLRGARAHHPLRVKRWRLTAADADLIDALERRSPRQFEICQALRQQPDGLTAADLKQINPHWHVVMLDTQLAHRRHFPAINWTQSFSLYSDTAMAHFVEEHEEWAKLQARCRDILQREEALREVAEVVGMEGLQDGDRLLMGTAEKIRLDFLCQNSFTEDAFAAPKSTIESIATLVAEHDQLSAALDGGALLDDLLKEAANAPR